MLVYTDCLKLRSLNRRENDENQKKRSEKRNFLVCAFFFHLKNAIERLHIPISRPTNSYHMQ